ncbi:MAG TPA: TIGR04086 family membrane protein [Firmicutes bacterium]|jgi:putative membrane protein (TIGR04086 family)|nr:TIGR04086 family membrane protein [Bacillota bacterium]HAW70251.1 TIGR04086 family membrane protein [Bacillota bacterium]HAZ22375.1 TIGR04086 family membrane protein [Bacillota bacterium]HBG44693.1 TIGR04086 family membrane protein [Bacillota bacterium]HBL51357.1 TIGR04086 family membrane protein [Bacillota bacterium]
MKDNAVRENSSTIGAIVRGLFISLLFGVVVLILFTIVLSVMGARPTDVPMTIVLLSYVTALFGSITAGRHSPNRGWLAGGLTGALFMILLLLFFAMIPESVLSWPLALLRIACAFPVGALGGMLGVNIGT